MNKNHHRPAWGIALAAGILTVTSACGAPASIGDVNKESNKDKSSDTKPFQGSPRQLDDAGQDTPAPNPEGGVPRRGGPEGWN